MHGIAMVDLGNAHTGSHAGNCVGKQSLQLLKIGPGPGGGVGDAARAVVTTRPRHGTITHLLRARTRCCYKRPIDSFSRSGDRGTSVYNLIHGLESKVILM